MDVPGRVNTYVMCGLPPIIMPEESAIRDFLYHRFWALGNGEHLISNLKRKDFMTSLGELLLEDRHEFSMQYELPKITRFFEEFL